MGTEILNKKSNLVNDYLHLRKNLDDDLQDIVLMAKKIINSDVQDLLSRCRLTLDNSKNYLQASVDELCCDVNKVFKNFNYENKNKHFEKTNQDSDYNSEKEKCGLKNNVDDLIIESKILKITYTDSIRDFTNNSSEKINELAMVISGKMYNSQRIKDKKPRRLWRWVDRIEYVRGIILDGDFSSVDLKNIEELRTVLQKNTYLKRKKRNYLDRLDECLRSYTSK